MAITVGLQDDRKIGNKCWSARWHKKLAINVGLQDGMDTLAMNTACKKGEMASFWRSISTNFVWECKN